MYLLLRDRIRAEEDLARGHRCSVPAHDRNGGSSVKDDAGGGGVRPSEEARRRLTHVGLAGAQCWGLRRAGSCRQEAPDGGSQRGAPGARRPPHHAAAALDLERRPARAPARQKCAPLTPPHRLLMKRDRRGSNQQPAQPLSLKKKIVIVDVSRDQFITFLTSFVDYSRAGSSWKCIGGVTAELQLPERSYNLNKVHNLNKRQGNIQVYIPTNTLPNKQILYIWLEYKRSNASDLRRKQSFAS
ncbi:Protein of unknown function [Gryllus bimaculatus]|nr:Protein of unknown function [Gryllus bimaculatus]